MLSLAIIALIALIALAVGLFAFQDRLLYFPTRTTLEAYETTHLPVWPDRADVRGLIAEPTGDSAVRGTAIVFHGNAGHAGHRPFYLPPLTRAGLRTVLAEFPGYGPREGRPGEALLVDDAVRTIELAHAAFGAPVLVIGESLGAAVAAAAAARVNERERGIVGGLLLITPWNRLADVASHHYPWLPVRKLLRESWDSVAHLRAFDRPIVVVAAASDSIVPARYGRALFDALTGPKAWLEIAGAGHNDWAGRVDTAWWQRTIEATGLIAPR